MRRPRKSRLALLSVAGWSMEDLDRLNHLTEAESRLEGGATAHGDGILVRGAEFDPVVEPVWRAAHDRNQEIATLLWTGDFQGALDLIRRSP